MSFGSGGFGGFGSNQQSTFGGFGSNNNNTSTSGGFGSNSNSGGSIFGQSNNTSGGGMFGGGNNNNSTSSPFGGGGGFGNNTTTSFGSTPFSGGGSTLFGGNKSASGTTFGGFGSTSNTTSSPFGGASSGGGLFGQNKTGFGSSTSGTTGGSLFGGGGGGTTGGFGTSTGGFGSSTSGGFGVGGGANTTNNGTASTPFQPFEEKDPGATNSRSQYQTITFQAPYQNYSLEELRMVDYNQGRRYGNQNGQAGAFGQSTGFGGFGSNTNTSSSFGAGSNTGGGLFGNTSNTGTTFGSNAGSGFGGNTGGSGGLFGQNKPAGGLFGSTTATSQPGTSGGLFGSTSNTGGGFGSGGTGTGFGSSSGGGLFGQQNQQQSKPAFGGFGNTSNTASAPFGGSSNTFGQSNTGGGLFGQQNQTSATPAFGSTTQTSTSGGGLFGGSTGGAFGQNQQPQQQNQQSGGLFGGFGQNQQNQQKPGGLFGSSTTGPGGGLFGNNQQQQQQQPQQSGGGLFGQSKPGGLFGSTTASQPASGGLFGSTSGAPGATSGGLFGGLNTQSQQQNTGGGLFGSSTAQQKPGGLFGGSNTNANTGGGLFGNLGGQNANQPSLGGSLFGNQSQQQQQQPANSSLFGASGSSLLQTSMNTNPYGNDTLFAGLATPTQSPGPLATPLSSSQKNRRSAILPQHKLNPSQSTRLLTPQGKRNGGYGFTYSTYGTPNSASSQSSPLNGSIFGSGSLSRSLGKSLSTSNLRNSFTPDTSILAPGAFSTNGRSFGSGSLKKLNINRSINSRPSLFEDASPAKRVSFAGPSSENGLTNGTTANGSTSGALVVRDEPVDSSPGSSSTTMNGETSSAAKRPEMEQVNGKELTPVPENGALAPRTSSSLNVQNGQIIDPKAGAYYSQPSLDELRKMSKDQLKNVSNFVVGRDKVGKIDFNMGKPVDLSEVNFDKVFDNIVQLNHRNATVYGDTCAVVKPQVGSGLNYPSRIILGNSWPRGSARSGRKDQKHIERLKRVTGTTFEDYKPETGEWIFTVPHFSSYGFDYDDEEESSELSPIPDTPAQVGSSQMTGTPQDDSFASPDQSSPDDTFDFKRGMRKRANVPGQFGDESAYEEDEEMEDTQGESFLGERSVGSLDGQQDYSESESEPAEDQDMADSVSRPIHTTERTAAKQSDPFKESVKPKSILKTSQLLRPASGTPMKGPLMFDDDWANTLQRTISPKKQDRAALRGTQGDVLRERDGNAIKMAQSMSGQKSKFTMNHMDLMDSLFGEADQQKESTSKRIGHGMQLPYPKRAKTSHDLDQLTGTDKDFHSCSKPHFSETGVFIYAGSGKERPDHDIYLCRRDSIAGAEKDIRFKKLPTFSDAVPPTLDLQKQHTKVYNKDVPYVKLRTEPDQLDFDNMADVVPLGSPAGTHEQQAWQLLSLLFDGGDKPADMSDEKFEQQKDRVRKERLSDFWKALVYDDAQKHVQDAQSAEEKAIAYLTCNSIADACHALLQGLDLRLATMVAQIGGDEVTRQDMTSQIEEWRRMDVLAEMDGSVRALYELIAGNCAQSDGKTGGGRENKAPTFNISSLFKLDWRRAFGLRLWYGIMAHEPLELAVAQFADALRDGKENVKPKPWFIEQEKDMGWADPEKDHREDLLWGILKLYASAKMEDMPANIEDVLAPENVSGHPLNARLSFQLFNIFDSRRNDPHEDFDRMVGMPVVRHAEGSGLRSSFLSSTASNTDKDDQAEEPLVELGDKLAITYAGSLHTPEYWTSAVWVYMHLSNAGMRSHYIRALLTQFSNTYSLSDTDPISKYLSTELYIPQTWMHLAAALQAKTEGDALRQAMHLIKADELEEAHEVLCRSVGPDSIISRDYDALRELIGGFIPTPTNSPTSEHAGYVPVRSRGRSKEPVPGWSHGGQIYFDYIELLDLTGQRSAYRVDEELNQQISNLLSKLQHALEVVARDKWEGRGLEERVALTEIAGTVASLIAKTRASERSRVLKLPLTEDQWLMHSCALSTNYYRNVMAR